MVDWLSAVRDFLKDWIAPFGIILSALGLGFALRNVWKERAKMQAEQERLHALLDGFQTIERQMSTRSLGAFPHYLPQIAELISTGNDTIKVISPNPAPGIFTAPGNWDRIRHTLEERARAGVKVHYLSCDLKHREQQFDRQFPQEEGAASMAPAEFWEARRQFIAYHGRGAVGEGAGEFKTLMMQKDNELLGSWRNLMNVRQLAQDVPLWAWIVDEERAIFAVSNSVATAYAFSTRDLGLVKSLLALYDRYEHESAEPRGVVGGE